MFRRQKHTQFGMINDNNKRKGSSKAERNSSSVLSSSLRAPLRGIATSPSKTNLLKGIISNQQKGL